jgi:hypothetical protein
MDFIFFLKVHQKSLGNSNFQNFRVTDFKFNFEVYNFELSEKLFLSLSKIHRIGENRELFESPS